MTRENKQPVRGIVISTAIIALVVILVTYSKILVKEPLRIGLATTLTGTSSTFGLKIRNGAVLAVEQINKQGGINGHPVQLIVKDDKLNPDEALRVDRELIDEGVLAIIGHYLSTLAVKTVPLMNEQNMLMISPTVTTTELTGIDDNFIRLLGSVDKQSQLIAELIFNRLGKKKIAVVYDLSNPKYSETLYRYFDQAVVDLGGEIVKTVPFNSLEKYSAPKIANEITNSEAECLFLITNAIHGALVCQHLRKSGSEIKIIGCQWNFTDHDFITNGGRAVEGVVAINAFNADSSEERFLSYKQEYEHRFGERVSMADQIAYETTQVLLSALLKSSDPYKLKTTLLNQRVFKGVDGDIVIDEFGDTVRTMYILEIKNGIIRTTGIIQPSILPE